MTATLQENRPDETIEPDTSIVSREPSDSPPSYSQKDIITSPTLLPNLAPCNFFSLLRQGYESIEGKWIVQPSLHIPSAFLPPLRPNETEGTRRNILLSTCYGIVDAEIYILRSDIEGQRRNRVCIETSSSQGSITMKVHDVSSTDPKKARLPISIFSSSSSFSTGMRLYIPRTFQGPMTVSVLNGKIHLSEAIQASVTPFSDIDHTQKSFLGHFDPTEWENNEVWVGDELSAESEIGHIYISFIDEIVLPKAANPLTSSFLERILPFWS